MKRICIFLLIVLVVVVGVFQIYIHLQQHPIKRVVRYTRPCGGSEIQDGKFWETAFPSLAAWEISIADHVCYVRPVDRHEYATQTLTLNGWAFDGTKQGIEIHNVEVIK